MYTYKFSKLIVKMCTFIQFGKAYHWIINRLPLLLLLLLLMVMVMFDIGCYIGGCRSIFFNGGGRRICIQHHICTIVLYYMTIASTSWSLHINKQIKQIDVNYRNLFCVEIRDPWSSWNMYAPIVENFVITWYLYIYIYTKWSKNWWL